MIDKSLFQKCSLDIKRELELKDFDFNLVYKNEFLTFESEGQSLSCDFISPKYLTEVRQNFSRSEGVYSFLKVISKNKKKLSILDLTAGLGRDLFKFVLSGHKLKAFEKDPVLYLLLEDGLKRFRASPDLEELKERFRLETNFECELNFGDSLEYLKETEDMFDLIYFDPMFQDKSKKAAPKKHMQIIKSLVKSDEIDKSDVISKALDKAQVVLKSSKYYSDKLKPNRLINFKGFSFYIFNG